MTQANKAELKKILMADIEKARTAYIGKRGQEVEALKKEILANPKGTVKKLYEEALKAYNTKERIDKELEEMGLKIAYSGSYPSYKTGLEFAYYLERASNPSPEVKSVNKFNEETTEGLEKLESLKRDYTLNIIDDTAETKDFFKKLAEDIKKILG